MRVILLGCLLVAAGALAGTLLGSDRPQAAAVVATVTVTEPAAPGPAARAEERIPLTALPDGAALARARAWLAGRAGRTAFAVVDSAGRLRGTRMHERFASASLVKAMLLVAHLRAAARDGRALAPGERALLDPMIRTSDNDAASAIFALVGEPGLAELGAAAGMTDLATHPFWGETGISAADQARFLAQLDRLLPAVHAAEARALLASVVPAQSWGIPAAARPHGFTVMFKGGWREDIVNQAALLEGPCGRFALAVLSDGNPSMAYGVETIAGLTAALLTQS